MSYRFKQHHTTSATADPAEVLLEGEWGVETDTFKAKIGDGVTTWGALPYVSLTPAEVAALIAAHAAAVDPHPGYLTQAEGDGAYVQELQHGTNLGKTSIVAGNLVTDIDTHWGIHLGVPYYEANVADVTAGEEAILDVDETGAVSWVLLTDVAAKNTAVEVETARAEAAEALLAPKANPVFTGTVTIPDGALAIADTSGLQAALDLKAALASPALTGTPTAPTAAQGTNTTQLASTAYVQTEVGLLVPKSLVDAKGDLLAGTADNTLGRLAAGTDDYGLVADSTQTTGLKWKARSRSISDVHADAGPVNSVAETTLATLTVPTTVAAGDIVRAEFSGDMLNNTGSNVTATLKLKVGTTTVFTSSAASAPTSATRRGWDAAVKMLLVSTSDERLRMRAGISSPGNQLTMSSGLVNAAWYGTAAEDLTSSKDLVLTVTLNTASASADFILHEATLEVSKR